MRVPLTLTTGAVVLAAMLLTACGSDEPTSSTDTLNLTGAAATGQQVAQSKGCHSCHSADGTKGVGPSWKGLYGREVQLTDGKTITADDAYIRRSIEDPNAQVVKGYSAIMPKVSLSATEIDQVIAYIKAISGNAGGEDGSTTSTTTPG